MRYKKDDKNTKMMEIEENSFHKEPKDDRTTTNFNIKTQ